MLLSTDEVHSRTAPHSPPFIPSSAKFLVIFFLPNFSSTQKLLNVKATLELPLVLVTGTCSDRKKGDTVKSDRE